MRRLLGLRTQVMAALLAVTAVALAGAAVALFLPLERRLRQDALANLATNAAAASDDLRQLPRSALRPQSPQLMTIIRSLHRSGIEARIVTSDGRELTRPDSDDRSRPASQLQRSVASGRPLRAVIGSGSGAEALVVRRVSTRAGPVMLGVRSSLESVEAARTTFRDGFLRAAAVSLLIALVLGALLTSRLVRRIRALRRSALEIAAAGPGATPPADDSHDEIGDLTRAFATMQARLTAQEEARKAFVATASHELRTPIASLRLRLGLLREELAAGAPAGAPDDLDEQVALADEQAARLAQLAADLLDLSRLDADLPLRRETVGLAVVCRAVVAEFDAIADVPVVLRAEGDAAADRVEADPGKVAQIVRILIDNARRYAPAGSSVRVVVGEATVAVEDDGPGVEPAEQELIFERFRRGSGHDSHAGFGLGLAIGRELAERMGGALVLAHARRPTRFALRLPAAGGRVDRTGITADC